MATTPLHGIPYPEDPSLIDDLVLDFKALADGVDAALEAMLTAIFGALRPKIIYGQRTVNISSAASGTTAVTFSSPFTSPPVLFGGCVTSTSTWIGSATSATNSGCNVNAFHRDGSTGTTSLSVSFLAIGV